MELRALLCWASLAAALEGEFPWGHPATPGTPKLGLGVEGPTSLPQLRTLRTNSARPDRAGVGGRGQGGGGPAGSRVFFCLGKR